MLRATGLTKRFGQQQVIRGVDLTIEPGRITAIIGPSGAGKSTLLRAMSLLEPPDSGSIQIDDRIYRFPNDRQLDPDPWPKLGVVFQQLFLWPHLTLRRNITLPLELRGAAANGRVDHLLELFELTQDADRYPNQTSLGQRQRAALIRALVLDPKYLLLDEITSALDVEHVVKVLGQLREARKQGTGILLVTHLIGFARKSADQVAFLESGAVLESGDAAILSDPKTERLNKFLSLVETAV